MSKLKQLYKDQETNERRIRLYESLIAEAIQNNIDTDKLERSLNQHRRYHSMTAEMIAHMENEIAAGVDRPQSMPRKAVDRKSFWERFHPKNWK